MTSTLKLYGGIAFLAILILAGWGVAHWDNNRLEAAFNEGVQTERLLWVTAATDAKDKATAQANTNTLISERTADQARVTAEAITAASTAVNQSIVEKITRAYQTNPQASCDPDAAPVDLPDGVLEGLSEARSAALGSASAASGRLQPAKRQ